MTGVRTSDAATRSVRVGVVSHHLGDDAYERGVLGGIVGAIESRGASAICFAANGAEKDLDEFVGMPDVDGWVLLAAPLVHALGVAVVEAFCEKRRGLPITGVGSDSSLPLTHVFADGSTGIRKAIAHLVEVHHKRRIGYVRGPETTLAIRERFAGYARGLADHGIPENPAWIAQSATLDGGAEAVRLLFDERRLELDALITFNDAAAISALAALVDRGIRVPADVAVIGYHDIPETDQVIPPLTTVTQKLYEQGWRAAHLVLDAVEGKELPAEVVLEPELVLRRSCGCFPRAVLDARAGGSRSGAAVGELESRRRDIALALTAVVGLGETKAAEALVGAFAADLEEGGHRFLSALDERLNDVARRGLDLGHWDEALSVMRRMTLPSISIADRRRARAEDMWHEARALVGDTGRRAQASRRMADHQRGRILASISQSLIAAHDVDALAHVLREGLSRLGVRSCHVRLDAKDSQAGSTLLLDVDEGPGQKEESGSVTVVIPLAFDGAVRGKIVLGADPTQPMSYGELSEQFGAAFKRMEAEKELARLHEVQQKLLISERMASLGRLTAGMAHEMNTPLAAVRAALGELLKLIQEYRASVDAPDVTAQDHREIAAEMEASTRLADSAAQRVAGFVRGIKAETRDLSAQEFCDFDPVPVIEETLLLLSHAARSTGCTIQLAAQGRNLALFGSPTRLAQVVTNLVTNAIDASADKGGGPIELVLEPWERGVELRVSDCGSGIASDDLGKIFQPLYTSKPFGRGTGLGLPIVRDIVTGDFNGTIEVKSEVGVGTTFVLRLTSPG